MFRFEHVSLGEGDEGNRQVKALKTRFHGSIRSVDQRISKKNETTAGDYEEISPRCI